MKSAGKGKFIPTHPTTGKPLGPAVGIKTALAKEKAAKTAKKK